MHSHSVYKQSKEKNNNKRKESRETRTLVKWLKGTVFQETVFEKAVLVCWCQFSLPHPRILTVKTMLKITEQKRKEFLQNCVKLIYGYIVGSKKRL